MEDDEALGSESTEVQTGPNCCGSVRGHDEDDLRSREYNDSRLVIGDGPSEAERSDELAQIISSNAIKIVEAFGEHCDEDDTYSETDATTFKADE